MRDCPIECVVGDRASVPMCERMSARYALVSRSKSCNFQVAIQTNCPMITQTDVTNDGPVCAINEKDGYKQNYANVCQLRRDACQRQVELKVLHHGHCGMSPVRSLRFVVMCANWSNLCLLGHCRQQCQHYATCKPNEHGLPECVCPQVCIRYVH